MIGTATSTIQSELSRFWLTANRRRCSPKVYSPSPLGLSKKFQFSTRVRNVPDTTKSPTLICLGAPEGEGADGSGALGAEVWALAEQVSKVDRTM
jgi:hypothetical protein